MHPENYKTKPYSHYLEKYETVLNYINKLTNKSSTDNWIHGYVSKKVNLIKSLGTELNNELKRDTLIHGDFHIENVFYRDEKVYKIFDFDRPRIHSRYHELIRSMSLTCFEHEITDQSLDLAKVYIKTYHNIYPIDTDIFKEGVKLHFYGLIRTAWAEEDYYFNNNKTTLRAMQNDLNRICYFENNLEYVQQYLLR